MQYHLTDGELERFSEYSDTYSYDDLKEEAEWCSEHDQWVLTPSGSLAFAITAMIGKKPSAIHSQHERC